MHVFIVGTLVFCSASVLMDLLCMFSMIRIYAFIRLFLGSSHCLVHNDPAKR
jgi:hypothetical protein